MTLFTIPGTIAGIMERQETAKVPAWLFVVPLLALVFAAFTVAAVLLMNYCQEHYISVEIGDFSIPLYSGPK
jgi:hypothetical protein